MSKLTREELLMWFDNYRGGYRKEAVCWTEDDKKKHQAIRNFIKQIFDWQEKATYVLANIALGEEGEKEKILKAIYLLEEIRDDEIIQKTVERDKPKITRNWIAEQVMYRVKPGKYTTKKIYKESIRGHAAMIEEIFVKAGVEIEGENEKI